MVERAAIIDIRWSERTSSTSWRLTIKASRLMSLPAARYDCRAENWRTGVYTQGVRRGRRKFSWQSKDRIRTSSSLCSIQLRCCQSQRNRCRHLRK